MNRLVKKMAALAVCGLLLTGLIGGVSEASAHHRQAPAPQYDQQEGPDPHREEPKPHRDEHREPQPEPPRTSIMKSMMTMIRLPRRWQALLSAR